jgi:hypothetical protein
MKCTFNTFLVEGTDEQTVVEVCRSGSCDDLQPSSLELRHHVVMLNSKHGSSRDSL